MTLVIVNTDALVANAPFVKSEPGYSPPVIKHQGISSRQLGELTGCIRKATPNPFPGSLGSWKGKKVSFALMDGSAEVTRIIESITVKPLEFVNKDDLKGTLAEIAMRELNLPFKQFFQEAYGDQDVAMVIRVRAL